jgi:arginyl-tRNA synthetase
MLLAKVLQKNPRDIAMQITSEFNHPYIAQLEVAGPGFLNATLTLDAIKQLAHEISSQGSQFFKLSTSDPKHTSIEFVSANPTGPLHFGTVVEALSEMFLVIYCHL